jgi:hypothetical protein
LDYDIEVLARWEGCLEEGDDCWEEGAFAGTWVGGFVRAAFVVDFFVEDVMEQDFEAVGEV